MAKVLRYILRDCDLFVDRIDKIGQVAEISVPVLEAVTEEIRNAGMIKPREINMGIEKTEMSFEMPSMDPQVYKLFGLAPGTEKEFMATGALVDEDGTVHSAVIYMRGFMKKSDPGKWKSGEKSDNSHDVAVHSFNLEVDGNPILEVDDFDVIVGGVSQYANIKRALLTQA